MKIRVTAEVQLDYDTEDGLVSTPEEAVEDMFKALHNRTFSASDFSIGWVEA